MMILWKTKTVLNIISLCLCGLTFLNMLRLKNNGKFEKIRRGLSYLFSRKFLIIFCCFAFLTAYCGSQYYCNGRLPQLRVKFNYEEAAKGLNPNKTRFNASKLLSDEILEKAIEKGDFDISVEELSGCLELSSGYDNQEIDAFSEMMDIATEYQVICRPEIFRYGIDANGFMSLLADVYYEEFIGSYSENDSILDLTYENLEDMDYMDADNYLEMQAKKLQHFISCYSSENPTYRLEGNGETFSSLTEKITNFIEVELERLRSFVLENGLSREADDYVTRMNHQNRLLQVEYEKNMASYDVRLETIEMYDEEMARVVLVPTNDENLQYYMSRTKIGVDYFAQEADQALHYASFQKEEMEHNTYAKAQITSSGRGGEAYKKADAMLAELKEELDSLSKQSEALADSYISQKRRGYLKVDSLRSHGAERLKLKNGVVNTAIFGIVLCGYLLTEFLKNENGSEKRKKL